MGVHPGRGLGSNPRSEGGHMKKAAMLAVLLAATAAIGAGSAWGAGGTRAYRATFSFHCENKASASCGAPSFGLGSSEGRYTFQPDGTFDGQVTSNAHSQGGIQGGDHESLDGVWTTGPAAALFDGVTDDFYISTDGGLNWRDTLVPASAGSYAIKLDSGVFFR